MIYPPVDIDKFSLIIDKEDFYLTASRLVAYKKTKLIVEAFIESRKPLIVAGTGTEYEEIKKIATSNITVLGYVQDEKILELMSHAKAFVFASYEDFGIVPVEAMACGTPIIAYGKGGIRDTVVDGKTGIFFHEQTVKSLNYAVNKFESTTFDYEYISKEASKFSTQRFEKEIKTFVDEKVEKFFNV